MVKATKNFCKEMGEGNVCGKPYREFTTIFHDELTAMQAFHELSEEDLPISSLRDGHGINYGSAGLGAMVLANRRPFPVARRLIAQNVNWKNFS